MHDVWKMCADEDVMTVTANLFTEVSKGPASDPAKVQKMLEQGADNAAANGEGSTCLMLAVYKESPAEVVRLLLENGACPDGTGR